MNNLDINIDKQKLSFKVNEDKNLFLSNVPLCNMNSDKYFFETFHYEKEFIDINKNIDEDKLRIYVSNFYATVCSEDAVNIQKLVLLPHFTAAIDNRQLFTNFISDKYIKDIVTTKTDQSFETILDKIAAEIIFKVKESNKQLCLMLSGGLDSTCVLYAIIDSPHFYLIKNKFIVMTNERIWNEYPKLPEMLEKRKIKLNILSSSKTMSVLLDMFFDHLFINGEGGDQLSFSSVQSNYKIKQILGNELYKIDAYSALQRIFGYVPNFAIKLLKWVQPNMRFTRFGQILNLLFKTQWTYTRPAVFLAYHAYVTKHRAYSIINTNNYLKILSHSELRKFAMTYWDNDYIQPGNKIKPFIRDYIYKHNNDTEYRDTKQKVRSVYTMTDTTTIGYVSKNGSVTIKPCFDINGVKLNPAETLHFIMKNL